MLENEIKVLQKHLRSYDNCRTQLLKAMEFEDFDGNEVLDRLNSVKRESAEDEEKLAALTSAKNNIVSMAEAKVKFNKLYVDVLTNLDDADFETKRLVLDALDTHVVAGPNEPKIRP